MTAFMKKKGDRNIFETFACSSNCLFLNVENKEFLQWERRQVKTIVPIAGSGIDRNIARKNQLFPKGVRKVNMGVKKGEFMLHPIFRFTYYAHLPI